MIYYADTSALIKRYVVEAGSGWMVGLCDPVAGNLITTALITRAEAAAALARKYRDGGLSASDYANVLRDLNHDFLQEYALVQIDRTLIDLAVALTRRQKLRGYDAVQLAAAITLNTIVAQTHTMSTVSVPVVTFLTADSDLAAAAQAEGLTADNPIVHI